MGLGCRLNSVRGNRGGNYKTEQLVHQKHIKKKKYNVYKTKSVHGWYAGEGGG
jgi:hypothetical protein